MYINVNHLTFLFFFSFSLSLSLRVFPSLWVFFSFCLYFFFGRSQLYSPGPLLWIDLLEKVNSIKLAFWVETKAAPWYKPGEYLVVKHAFMLSVQDLCEKYNISFHFPPQPVDASIENLSEVKGHRDSGTNSWSDDGRLR